MKTCNKYELEMKERDYSFLIFINKLDLFNKMKMMPHIDKTQLMPIYNEIMAKIKCRYNLDPGE